MGWAVNNTSRLFSPWKDPVPIVYEAGWAPEPVWTGAANLSPTGIRSLDSPARRQFLYRLSYPGSEGAVSTFFKLINHWSRQASPKICILLLNCSFTSQKIVMLITP